ncbi:MAG TPA: type II toxin-antitoxin system prevent-host-death family antitoxin [Thermoanaerobaculia bacterium]|nr:type II toxin-antitoxin system prevent-host-death family antitoxin [Thermoanaerobaculia bacterium]
MRVRLDEDIRPLSEFQANAEKLLDEIRATRRALVLTEEGRSSAVVIDVAEFESLLEELETLREIHLAEQQISSGQGVPHELAREQILSALKQ